MPVKSRMVFYGSSAGFPTDTRDMTCLGLWQEKDLYLLDAGEPASAHFARYRIAPDALRAVFLTHTHADHIGGLPMLLQWMQLNGRKESLTLCLPAEAIPIFRDYLDLLFLFPDLLGFDLEYKPVAPGKIYDRNNVSVEAFSNRHLALHAERLRREGRGRSGQSFSYLVTVGDTRLLFSGDIREPAEIVPLVDRANLAVVEMAHFSPEELGRALRAAPLPKLILTHLLHTLEPMEENVPERVREGGFGGEVLLAHDGDEVTL